MDIIQRVSPQEVCYGSTATSSMVADFVQKQNFEG
eukprot:CAMPEP_0114036080 /NCGR_PEP_ID=MMETSP1159-20121227/7448_1 /TAXON_ID=88271 /ORGANISM="Picocystis salinarum" /LENGTH=34 /assembly_acc=CAM_ASM_000767